MAKSGTPWHICDNCLDPLARKLDSIAQRLGHSFDVEKAIRLDTEYRQIQKDSNYCDTRLTDAQRKRQDELNEQMRAQIKPPRARDIEYLYQDYRIKTAIEWLKFYVSVEYADSFEHKLFDATKRFFDLEFKACQIINHDEGKESTIEVRYPIQRLIDRHYKLLRELFPEHEHHPNRNELPEYLRAFEVEIMEEYDKTKKQIQEVPKYLQLVSALARSKMKKADVSEIQEAQARKAGNTAHRDDEEPEPSPTTLASNESSNEAHRPSDEKSIEMPVLSERKYLILSALLEMGAISANTRETTARIVAKAEGDQADPVQFKPDIAYLKNVGYVSTKDGRGGGCWLTSDGYKLASLLI